MGANVPSTVEPRPISIATLFINPYGSHHYQLDVAMSSTELHDRMKEDTAAPVSWTALTRAKPLMGDVGRETFAVTWLKKPYRNSWSPVAVGTISPNGKRCTVDVTFRLHMVVLPFMLLWMVGATVGCIAFLVCATDLPLPWRLIPIVMPLFGCLISWIGAMMGRNDQRAILNYFSQL